MKIPLMLLSITLLLAGAAISDEGRISEPIGMAAYILNMPGFGWITHTSDHFRLHYLPGSAAEQEIDSLVVQNEESLASHLEILGIKKYDKVIDFFYFDSRDQIKRIVSKPFRALADAESMTVLAIRSKEEIGRDAHEIMHVVSYDLWGKWDRRTEMAWLGEGLATYADKPCNGCEMSVLASHILQNTGDSVPLDSLATNFRQYPEMVGYILMESFVEFVLVKYGVEYLRDLWNEGYDGLEEVLGKTVAEIEMDWHEYVIQKYPDPNVPNWAELKENGCK